MLKRGSVSLSYSKRDLNWKEPNRKSEEPKLDTIANPEKWVEYCVCLKFTRMLDIAQKYFQHCLPAETKPVLCNTGADKRGMEECKFEYDE